MYACDNTPGNCKPKGGGRADSGAFKIFIEAKVEFPIPGHQMNVKITMSTLKFLTQQTILDVKILTLGELHDVKFLWVPPTPHLGA